jgi:hypothetical protein
MNHYTRFAVCLFCLALFKGKIIADDFIETSRVTDSSGGVSVNEDYINLSAVGQTYHTRTTTGGTFVNQSGFINAILSEGVIRDTDGDGLLDEIEVNYYGTNPLKADTDGDGLSDGEEVLVDPKTDPTKADTDGDGLTDYEEVMGDPKTDPTKADTDGDGLSDYDEVMGDPKTDPTKADTDGDGLSDYDEVKQHGTDPTKADTDEDGLKDGDELFHKTLPLNPDTDGDLLPDGWEIARGLDPLQHDGDSALAYDPDGDGMSNADELVAGTDPLDGNSYFTLNIDSTIDSIRLRWNAIPERTYQVFASDSVTGPYQPLGPAQKHEGPAATEMDWQPNPDKPKSFYRLQVTR